MAQEHDWPTLLAREFCPAEEPVAVEVARCFAAGGRLRRSVLRGSGEQAGGFGGGAAIDGIAQVFDALAYSAQAVLAFLDRHQGIGTLVDSTAVAIALIESRRSRRAHPEPDDPEPTVTDDPEPAGTAGPEASVTFGPETVALLDDALRQLARRLSDQGRNDDAAWARACDLLLALERGGPGSAAAFVRDLTRTDTGATGRRWWHRWWKPRR